MREVKLRCRCTVLWYGAGFVDRKSTDQADNEFAPHDCHLFNTGEEAQLFCRYMTDDTKLATFTEEEYI